ncbi:endothelial lipase [Manduca sexta]|uniref:endothelial lipase n=1 Tax=Manduca sexta TaxID=7130 RepID=UPI00188EAF62|nr:endothelial lipase [Manduca sexta]
MEQPYFIKGKIGTNSLAFTCSFLVFVGRAATLVPRDNSHYIEGKSRYVWFPDGKGIPQLVDLHAAVDNSVLRYRNGAHAQYWLYTRQNPHKPQIIEHGRIDSIWGTNYNANKPLMVIIHGWRSDGNSGMNPLITEAYLTVQDANVIVVDWRVLADSSYVTAVKGAPIVGYFLGHFLNWFIRVGGGNWDNVHLVGFSLGAHIAGKAGRVTRRRPRRITGLDPAGPLWSDEAKGINKKSGQYVEVIHTDGDRLGIFNPIGNADFYPNGGRNPQPGCESSTCSHGRATELFASSVLNNHLVGRWCKNINKAEDSSCLGKGLKLGNSDLSKRGRGIYGLNTSSSWPF